MREEQVAGSQVDGGGRSEVPRSKWSPHHLPTMHGHLPLRVTKDPLENIQEHWICSMYGNQTPLPDPPEAPLLHGF